MGKVMRAIGLMSGTSMDGIDVALIETDGEDHVRRLAAATFAYPSDFRERLRQAMLDARQLGQRMARVGVMADVERELTERHAAATLNFMGDRMLQPSAIDVVGFHGQTVLHREVLSGGVQWNPRTGGPRPSKVTIQLGDGPLLARLTGIDVVYDLRAADTALGGQGAPLVPVYHRALVAKVRERPVALVNVGGVANVTWIGADGRLIAFDTGPGNALIDDWMHIKAGEDCDHDGACAADGTVDEDHLQALLMHPFFSMPPPKSLDRQAFAPRILDGVATAAGAATLTAFTAATIARSREHMPEEPLLWVITGGGRRNRTLMRMIAARVENAVAPAEALGLDGDAMEAEAWAYLAVRALDRKPITFPGTTGVSSPATGGVVVRAS